MLFSGALTALVTPFKDEALDEEAYRNFIEFQITEGIHGLVPCGTTGESATLSHEEHERVIEICIDQARGRVPVLAGAGSNNTAEAVRLTRFAQKAGANGALLITPYYNKPTQEGLYQHFKAIAEAVNMPMWLYNVPGRTVADLKNDTVLRLAQIPNIVGLKDATGDIARAIDLLRRLPEVVGDKEFAVYSGNDDSALALMLVGGTGVISVTANLMPREMHEMASAAVAGNVAVARAINNRLMPLHQKLFCEPNPVAPKWALYRMGRIGSGIRLPLTPLSEANRPVVEKAMREAGVEF